MLGTARRLLEISALWESMRREACDQVCCDIICNPAGIEVDGLQSAAREDSKSELIGIDSQMARTAIAANQPG
jgi:hypothetical protein